MFHVSSVAHSPPMSVSTSVNGVDVTASLTESSGGLKRLDLLAVPAEDTVDSDTTASSGLGPVEVVTEVINNIRNIDPGELRTRVEVRLQSLTDDPYAVTLDVIVESLETLLEENQ